jgi:hypothetical protein
MPLLNYSTSIEASKTVSEIHKILATHGARSILTNYTADGIIESLSFMITTPDGDRGVKLPINPDAILRVMNKTNKVPRTFRNRPQAIRIAWRIVKDWVEAQMAILETEMVQMEQVFLPYIEAGNGKTVFQLYQERQNNLLTSGEPKEME